MNRITSFILLVMLLAVSALVNYGVTKKSYAANIENYVIGQRIPDYKTARKVFWKKLYNEGGKTLYCGKQLNTTYNKGVNIEHVFPASWITYALRCGKRKQCRLNSPQFNLIEADLHNLYPSRSDINKARSNYKFAMIKGEKRVFGKCDFEFNERNRVAEPAPDARGRIARAMLYMADEYDLYLKKKLKRLLRDWDKEHRPEAAEYRRNDRIEKIQGNRNRYIDSHSIHSY